MITTYSKEDRELLNANGWTICVDKDGNEHDSLNGPDEECFAEGASGVKHILDGLRVDFRVHEAVSEWMNENPRLLNLREVYGMDIHASLYNFTRWQVQVHEDHLRGFA